VALLVRDDLSPSGRVDEHRDEVGHRPTRDEQRSGLAEQRGDPLLESPHRRVLPEDVVADGRFGHRPAHGLGRLRDRVGAQVDDG
jgi:hypothetical protein